MDASVLIKAPQTRCAKVARMAVSFGPVNSEMMRDVVALWLHLADDAEARAANPLRPLGALQNTSAN